MSIDTLKSKNVTKNVSLPAAWWERLDAIVAENKSNEKILTRSDLFIDALMNNHEQYLAMEKNLTIEPYTLEELT